MSALNSLDKSADVDKVVHCSFCRAHRQTNKQTRTQTAQQKVRRISVKAQTVISVGPQAQGPPGPHSEIHNSAKAGKQIQSLEQNIPEPCRKHL